MANVQMYSTVSVFEILCGLESDGSVMLMSVMTHVCSLDADRKSAEYMKVTKVISALTSELLMARRTGIHNRI